MGRSTVQWNLTKTICSALELDFPTIDVQKQIVSEPEKVEVADE